MMLFKHDSFYTKIFIDDWSCYNIWKNVNNSSQLLFDNKFCKGLNKNSIIALNNTSVNHDKQKRRKHMLSFSARPPAKSCIPIFTEKPVAMVTIMQMRWNYTVGHLFPPDIHPESFIKIASLVVEISSESISRPVSYLNDWSSHVTEYCRMVMIGWELLSHKYKSTPVLSRVMPSRYWWHTCIHWHNTIHNLSCMPLIGCRNVMSSQDVVNTVRERLKSDVTKLSSICEEVRGP